MNEQHPHCVCPECTDLTVKGLKLDGLKISIDPNSLPGGSGVEPGPDNTHLVSRDGNLAWDPIAPGGDGVNYSTEEQWTGKLWVDGKKIYQKTILITEIPNNTGRSYPHGIEGIEEVVNTAAHMRRPDFWISLPNANAAKYVVALDIHTKDIFIQTFTADAEQNYANATASVTLQYTCIDR